MRLSCLDLPKERAGCVNRGRAFFGAGLCAFSTAINLDLTIQIQGNMSR